MSTIDSPERIQTIMSDTKRFLPNSTGPNKINQNCIILLGLYKIVKGFMKTLFDSKS
jgi:hypothetical protein